MNITYRIRKRYVVFVVFLVVALQLFARAANDIKNNGQFGERIFQMALKQSLGLYHPYMLYINGEYDRQNMIYRELPLAMVMLEEDEGNYLTEYMQQPDNNYMAYSEPDSGSESADLYGGMYQELFPGNDYRELEQAVLAENTAVAGNGTEAEEEALAGTFVPVQTPAALYVEQQLRDTAFLRKNFYAVDATTQIKDEQLQYDTLMGFDASMKQDNSNVQILVYHTHSQEAYIDSVKGDSTTSIVGVGEHLCDILRTRYGFNVLHHTGEYDVESRDYAYSNAMKGLEQVLAENPTIEVMIDLHRDQTKADTRLVTTIQDKTMARFMFFNGLCYTKELGVLGNLPNPYIQDNLSLSFQMQVAADEYYPGLTRRIYLKGYRYNLHYRPKSMLIELGSQTNTVEEAMNSCEPLAHIIAMVLNGEN